MRTSALILFAATIASFLLICGSAVAAVDSSRPAGNSALAGTWSGRYGGAYSGTFTIHWRQVGSQLRGSITLSRPSGTFSITGSVRGAAIKFGAVGAGATYTGSVSGRTMSGHYKTAQGGGTWSAHKS
jgi:hypothetical protein